MALILSLLLRSRDAGPQLASSWFWRLTLLFSSWVPSLAGDQPFCSARYLIALRLARHAFLTGLPTVYMINFPTTRTPPVYLRKSFLKHYLVPFRHVLVCIPLAEFVPLRSSFSILLYYPPGRAIFPSGLMHYGCPLEHSWPSVLYVYTPGQ